MTRSSTRILVLAFATSALLHLALLFLPNIELAAVEIPPPPLTARLEAMPTIKKIPAKKIVRHKPHRAPPVTPPAPNPDTLAASAIPAASEVDAASAVVAASAIAATPTPEPIPVHPLPKKAVLSFAVYKGTDFRVGDAHLRFEIHDDHTYQAKIEANTTGIVSLFKKYDLTWASHGTIDAQGLHPLQYNDSRATGSGVETRSANFNQAEKILELSSGSRLALPANSQDRVSFMFQMTQLPWDSGSVVLDLCDGRRLDHYAIDIGAEETIDTNMGKLRALPFRKRHGADESALDIWLAAEYRWLPIKIRQTDRNGNVEFEMVVTEIRVADE